MDEDGDNCMDGYISFLTLKLVCLAMNNKNGNIIGDG